MKPGTPGGPRNLADYYDRYWLPEEERPRDAARPQLPSTLPPAVDRLLQHLIPSGSHCLDVGCGHGRAAGLPLTARGCSYIGVDISASAVAEARSIGLDARQIDDAAELPFPDREFDAVVSLEVIEHLVFPHHAVAEMVRVLKPGGVLVVTTPNVAYWRRRLDLALLGRWNPFGYVFAVEEPWADPHIRFFTPGALRRLLGLAGLSEIEIAGHGGSIIGDIPWIGKRLRQREGSPPYRVLERRAPALFGCFLNASARKPASV
ncbi:MAG TPA: class I SAM-dependent methyltransferase [Candidatus Dormibacteraeota bacterium]|nr:class I SAM-dependent methyltransferase [Candidatus Dormibacteraeota bacterium]